MYQLEICHSSNKNTGSQGNNWAGKNGEAPKAWWQEWTRFDSRSTGEAEQGAIRLPLVPTLSTARLLSPHARVCIVQKTHASEDVRRRAIEEYLDGVLPVELIAETSGVTRRTIYGWVNSWCAPSLLSLLLVPLI
jgi:hypothetical protein